MIYRFRDFELDDERCQLRRGSDPIAIQPKAFDLLVYLIRARDRVVAKTELLDRLWPDAVVGGHSVERAIHALRTALGDFGLPRGLVRSVSRRGYQFVAELRAEDARPDPQCADAPDRSEATADATRSDDVYVGRETLLRSLEDELGRAFAGEPRTFVLEGEAGIGKTRTAEEVARMARQRGARVLSGWCPENEAPAPFQPWLQILHGIVGSASWRRIRRTHPAAAADVEALLRGSVAGLATEAAPGEARFRLFDAVSVVLRAASEQQPILLFIDDLHAADAASLRLLEFVTRELRDVPLALVLALRTEEISLQHPVVPTLAELARRRAVRLRLPALTPEEVARCVAAWSLDRPAPEVLDELIRRSEGNPFFVRELSRWLSECPGQDASLRLPPNIRDVIRRRFRPRSERCAAALRLAAVIGREVELDVLLASAPCAHDVIEALEEALAAGVVEDVGAGARFRFAHPLIQEFLLEEQSSIQRAHTHRAVAAALAALDGEAEPHLAERAHHACEGADSATAEEAVACALRAAERATGVTAFEEAVRLYQRALKALALSPARSARRRCEILLALARAQAHLGDAIGAEGSYREAQAIAKELGDVAGTVRAAIGLVGSLPALAPPTRERIRALEEACASLGPQDPELQLAGLTRLALAWSAAGDRARGIRYADAVLREARQLGDPRAVAGALALRAGIYDPREQPTLRLRRVDEALRALAGAPAPRIELECRIQRSAALLELGDTQALDVEVEAYGTLAARLNQRTPRWYAEVQIGLRKLMTGDLEAAERQLTSTYRAGRRAGHPDADAYLAIQLTQLRFFQGRLAEMEAPLRAAAGTAPSLAGLRAALALVLSETGRAKEARRELHELARSDFAAIPRDAGWISNLSLLALVAARLRDPGHAAALEEQLAPFHARNVCAFVVAANGSARYFLGILAEARRDSARALASLEEAAAHNRRMGIAPWTAISELALANLLLEAGGRERAQRAAELAAGVRETAAKMGMSPTAAAARETARLAGHAAGVGWPRPDDPGLRRPGPPQVRHR